MYDGDTVFCVAAGSALAPYDAIEVIATDLVARAIQWRAARNALVTICC